MESPANEEGIWPSLSPQNLTSEEERKWPEELPHTVENYPGKTE